MWLLLAPATVLAAEPSADFRDHVEQARFFLKREWYADAATHLELATQTEDGRLDPEAWFMLASVRYELTDLGGAREAADRALVNSRTADQTQQASELLGFLEQQFGFLTLEPPHPGMSTKIEIELTSVIFDPQLKEYLNRLDARLDHRLTLPYTLGLPAGTYTLNGEAVEIGAGTEATFSPRIHAGGSPSLQVAELEIGIGAHVLLGTNHRIPGPSMELSLSEPLGPLVVGAMGSWTLRPYQTQADPFAISPGEWSVGVRAGVELPGTEPLVIRPSLTYRFGGIPGIELACARDAGSYTCAPTPAPDATKQLYIYGVGHAHLAGVELATIVNDRSRSSGFGAGLKTGFETVFARLPRAAEATLLGDGGTVAYEIDDNARGWTAFGLRILADVSYAF